MDAPSLDPRGSIDAPSFDGGFSPGRDLLAGASLLLRLPRVSVKVSCAPVDALSVR